MSTSGEDGALTELDHAYGEYRAAMAGWHAASKAAHVATAERAVERLLQARVELYQRLVATGWEPPPALVVQLDRDAALVAAPEDFEALLAV